MVLFKREKRQAPTNAKETRVGNMLLSLFIPGYLLGSWDQNGKRITDAKHRLQLKRALFVYQEHKEALIRKYLKLEPNESIYAKFLLSATAEYLFGRNYRWFCIGW